MNDWQRYIQKNQGKVTKDNLGSMIPRPADDKGHVIPYKVDDWDKIQGMRTGAVDMNLVEFKMGCVGCGIHVTCMVPRAFYDPEFKWLCEDCLDDRGFAWASTVAHDKMIEYQVVNQYPDDTLLRKLSKSPNYKEALHDPFDPDSNRKITG